MQPALTTLPQYIQRNLSMLSNSMLQNQAYLYHTVCSEAYHNLTAQHVAEPSIFLLCLQPSQPTHSPLQVQQFITHTIRLFCFEVDCPLKLPCTYFQIQQWWLNAKHKALAYDWLARHVLLAPYTLQTSALFPQEVSLVSNLALNCAVGSGRRAKRWGWRERHTLAQRQRDRQRQTHRQNKREGERHRDRLTETVRRGQKDTDRQTDRQTETRTDR